MAKVLVIGSLEDAKELTNYLANYENLCLKNQRTGCSQTSIINFPTTLTLKNKYFSAEICIYFCNFEDEENNPKDTKYEGSVIITKSNIKYDDMVLQKIKDITSEASVHIFAVFLKESNIDKDQKFSWTLDNGYEYIEIDQSDITQGWQEREKDGLPRLMEALQSNMWSTFQKLEQARPSTIPTPTIVEKKNPEQKDNLSETDLANQSFFSFENMPEVEEKDDDDEKMLEELQKIMTEARVMRPDGLSSMSDADRRQRAGDMALRLAAVLKLDESDED